MTSIYTHEPTKRSEQHVGQKRADAIKEIYSVGLVLPTVLC